MQAWTNPNTSIVPPRGARVPTEPEQLSAEWLTASLQHAGLLASRSRVTDFELAPLGAGRGFAGRLTRLLLRYDTHQPAAPSTMVAKFASAHAPSRRLMQEFGGYAREVRFYRELASSGAVAAPRAYLAHYEMRSGDFLLLLEDLAPSASPDRAAGLSLEQCRLAIDHLAAFHAHFWNRTAGLEWLIPDAGAFRRMADHFAASLPAFLLRFGNRAPYMCKVARHLGEALASHELDVQLPAGRVTLAHSDLHVDNIFFPTPAGGRFAIIDWQSLTLAERGTRDIARLLVAGMQIETRRQHERELLRGYHAALQRAGVVDDFDALVTTYHRDTLAIVLLWVVIAETFDFGNSPGLQNIGLVLERLEAALQDACRALGLG